MTELSVSCPDVVQVSAEFTARHLCPFVEEADEGLVTISWITSAGETYELHALAKLVASRQFERVSHEQWTADLAAALTVGAKVTGLAVASAWSTAGGTVTVRSCDGAAAGPSSWAGGSS